MVVFGRTPAKLQAFAEEFGYATTTEVSSIYDDPATEVLHAAVIDHVIACCQGRDSSRLGPASVLDTLQLTLHVRTALAAAKQR